MKFRAVRKSLLFVAVTSLATTGLVVTGGSVAVATAPTFTDWPSDYVPTAADVTQPFYGRLYMLAQSSSFSLPVGLTGIPVDGTMEFTGPDPIAGVDRDIQVTTDEAPLCSPTLGNGYNTGPCPRLQLDVFSGDSAGGIRFGATPTLIDDPGDADTRYRHSGGAVIDSITSAPNVAEPSAKIYLNGTETQINAALADLVYETGPDYRYDGNNGIRLQVLIESDDTSTSVTGSIEIRVLDVNQFPDVDGPSDKGTIQPQVDFSMPEMLGDPPEFTASDVDNDEDVDDDAPEPPCPADDSGSNDPDCDDPVDGPGSRMLLFAFMDCGEEIAPGTGFHFAMSTFEYNPPTLEGFFNDFLAGTPAGTPEVEAFLNGAQAAFDAIDPSLWSLPLASSQPTSFTNVFAGVTTMSEVQAALAQVTVRHNAPDDTCELYTVVSDLGNNGLPLQYIVTDPDDDIPFGWELPFLGIDVQQTTFGTGPLIDIDVSFDTSEPIIVNEADGPVDAVANLVIAVDGPDPTDHPGFTIEWSARPGQINDPAPLPGSGVAQAGFGNDHSNAEGLSIVVPPGATTVPVPGEFFPEALVTTVFDDMLDEGLETYEYELDITTNPAPEGYRIVSATQTRTVVIIDDDDGPATVSAQDAMIDEGDSGTANLTFTLSLDKPADGGESVVVETSDGTAEAADPENDYESVGPTTVTFDPGETETTVVVPVNGDVAIEDDETITLTLSDPTNVGIGDATGTGTITNDDFPPGVISVSDASVTEGDSGTTNVVFTLSLSSVSDGTESVVVTTMDGTATDADADYLPGPGTTVTFPLGETEIPFPVEVNGDDKFEADEVFTLVLSSPMNGTIGDGVGEGTILNDDDPSVISIADVTVFEGGPSNELEIANSNPLLVCAVEVTTTDDSAESPADFAALASAPFDADGVAALGLSIADDGAVEVDETFTVEIVLTEPVPDGCQLGTSTATVTIGDNDQPLVVSIADATIAEPDLTGTTTISMTGWAPTRQCVLTVSSANGTAMTPGDYLPVGGTFNLTVASDVVGINAADDDLVEGPETYTVSIVIAAGSDPACEIGDGQATITITSDDVPLVVSIADATIAESAGSITTTISMTGWAPSLECVLTVSSANGTAITPGDYLPVGGTFNLTVASDFLSVNAVDDGLVEGPETYTVSIVLAAGSDAACEIGDGQATVTITDDDSGDMTAPTVTIDQAVTQVDPTSVSPILFTVVFSEPVFGFTAADVDLSASTATGMLVPTVSGAGPTYTVSVIGMTGDGDVIASIDAAAATDGNSNASGASTSDDNVVTFEVVDMTAPTVTIDQGVTQVDPTSVSPILFTVVFSETVTGFDAADVDLSASTAPGTLVPAVSGTGPTYTVSVTGMTGPGIVTADVMAGAAEDATLNASDASTSDDNEVTFTVDPGDVTAPTVTINQAVTQVDPTASSPIVFTVVFSEPVTGFTMADVALSGTAGATTVSVGGSGSTYTVSVSGMPGPGTVIASVVAGAAQDAATNASTASTSTDNTVTYAPPDTPTALTITVPADITRPNDPGEAGADVTFAAATATGGVPPLVVSCDRTSGEFFPIGTTVVTCTAVDNEGDGLTERFVEATATATFSITVVDTEKPVIADPPDLIRFATSSLGVPVTFALPAATDNAGVPSVSCLPASGTTFKVGITVVTCTATDGAGNTASSTFTVTVRAPASGVPVTGSDPANTAALALALVALGILLRRSSLRRATPRI